ncbi:MAG: 2-oxoglutarate dehydrogenase complex dihydrolipoyllysine-residue succinyltransferase [Fibrella sp.]|nr:2-oxoglutarate dehydrogenase complex dihydrolipoyllysine-residue succinyltransferase [Armatimonadota bacterium]
MPTQIVVPNMGESVVEATIASWLKKAGDSVSAGEEIVELETDKVNQAIQAEASGVITEILKNEGETVSVGDILAIIGEAGGTIAPSANGTTGSPLTPNTGGTAETQFPRTGAESGERTSSTPAPPVLGAGGASGISSDTHSVVTPLAKTLAQDAKVDLATVTGTGTGGRITRDDVANRIEQAQAAPRTVEQKQQETTDAKPVAAPATKPVPTAQPSASGRPEERIRMTRRRKTIAANLMMATQNTAMLTTFNEVDMTAVMELRKRRKESFEKQFGIGLGFMSFFTKAVIGGLKQFPYLNAEIQGDDIVLKKYYDIGIAVGVEEGLVVPVVRDADKLGFAGIEKKIKEVAEKAKAGTLGINDLTGGSFTITNGGVYGSLMSTPILNYPQVGILGMHTIQQRVVVVDGEMAIRPMMYIALSYDHRIVDGGTAVRFLVKVKQLIEDPETLLLEG